MKNKILILLFVVSIVAGMIVPTTAISDDGKAPDVMGNPNEADTGNAPAAEQSADSGEGGSTGNTGSSGGDDDGIPDLDGSGGGCTL